MEQTTLNIKSLEKFKETIIIHILPFRFREKSIDLLLRNNGKLQDFSGFRYISDVTDLFAAARILLELVDSKIFILDQEVLILIFFEKKC